MSMLPWRCVLDRCVPDEGLCISSSLVWYVPERCVPDLLPPNHGTAALHYVTLHSLPTATCLQCALRSLLIVSPNLNIVKSSGKGQMIRGHIIQETWKTHRSGTDWHCTLCATPEPEFVNVLGSHKFDSKESVCRICRTGPPGSMGLRKKIPAP
jgi:hypothetical protein